MARPRHDKPHGGSKDGSADESDSPVDPTISIQTRRTRKRPAHPARDGSAEHPDPQTAARSQSQAEHGPAVSFGPDAAQRHVPTHHHRNEERRTLRDTTQHNPSTNLSTFESPNQARDRMALMRSNSSNSGATARSAVPLRSLRSTRTYLDHGLPSSDPAQSNGWRTSTPMARSLSSQSFSSRYLDDSASQTTTNSADTRMRHTSSQGGVNDPLGAVPGPLSIRTLNLQPQPSSAYDMTAPMARTNSNMSPPRPTRSLPRRRASARTQNRPLYSSNNGASSPSHARSRSSSNSNILAPSNSTANILASGQHNRQNSLTGCLPLGGGFDPTYNPPSGMSTPRTPLAEIPLWLADMRSSSRRSSASSSIFLDREDLLNAARSAPSRHARTASSSSSGGPTSPIMTRNGSTSPNVPFRRSLRGARPRQSDENARISPSPSYFGEYDALPSPSAASFQGQWTPLDESMDPTTSLSSSMNYLGTTSPSTPFGPLQPTASPAMSTRSRTLNRAGSVRTRRLTNPLNTPVSVDSLGLPYEAMRVQPQEPQSAFHQARSTAQERRTRNNDEQRSGTLLERRAATAAAAAGVAQAASHSSGRTSSRPSSRTSSPARGTRASRRRSTAVEAPASSALENSALGPRPGSLAPLQIPGGRLARGSGLAMPGVPTFTSVNPQPGAEGLIAPAAVYGPHPASQEPISPSAFSEMTTLTQGSSASESMNSTGGMPATPSSSLSQDPFVQTAMRFDTGVSQPIRRTRATGNEDTDADGDITLDAADESLSNRVLRQTLRKPQAPRDEIEEALGIQLRPRP
ncbi:hypothetical protein PSEUBRA_004103 [Kalmanozyma brasiliensis GHG001]|uniref:uncharacterized protein n=1 Tax=Kalmanozyma brasiliensis (strain GHG001) TaxID=1365824 RepID=UPI0028681433|nr:uncharacterized protein PSEUBRA_004103 [Kalmanozyma brasiliensis GHG001]KAF6767339.1 hypothetical protein PSEUBRA_004103 [Kalmanozyma brasiliensis GHG001]